MDESGQKMTSVSERTVLTNGECVGHVGLTSTEVQQRKADGRANTSEERQSRGYLEILGKNLFTPFNIILFVLGIALVIFDDVLSAIAATGVIIFNVLISTLQEWKAKRRLDKIAVLMRPKVNALRDGELKVIDRADIVLDDVLFLGPGDQAQVDGDVIEEHSLEMDESLLTGESSTRRKHVGETVYSGSYCVTGKCWFKVTKVGQDTFSSQMMSKARKFTKKTTPLQIETNTVTEILMTLAFIFMVILLFKNIVSGVSFHSSLKEAVIVLDIVPIALFLLITLTYMIAAVRMADSGVLLQNSNSVESISHVDTVCMDKTGTITTNHLVFEDVDYFNNDPRAAEDLVRAFVSATGSRNRTIEALSHHFGHVQTEMLDEIQFSSDRKYSAVRILWAGEPRTLFMGAWQFLKPYVVDAPDVESRLTEASSKGLRSVVIFDGGSAEIHDAAENPVVPQLRVLAVASIRDEVRPDCKEIITEFVNNGMDIKVISGDDPDTVEAIFKLAEIPGERKIISGDKLEGLSEEEFDKVALETNIFGRMKPEQKEHVIKALRRNERYVAMVGDGVNDIRSLKMAQVGVAVQSGSGATRGVADMVLMNDNFKALPHAIVEGKRTVSGMRDILRLYLSRNFVLAILVLSLLLVVGKSPLLPIQNTAYALLTVSFAAFLMTLWAKPSDNKELVLPKVVKFVVPSAIMLSIFGLAIYAAFYFGTIHNWFGGFFRLESTYQALADALDISLEELYNMLSIVGNPSSEAVMPYNIETIAEINARNAMFTFLVMAGIAQLFLLFPLTKRFAIEPDYKKDYKPTMLAVFLYVILVLFYAFPQLSVSVGQSLPMFEVWPELIAATAVWYTITLIFIKSSVLHPVSDFIEAYIKKTLQKNFLKNSKKADLEDE